MTLPALLTGDDVAATTASLDATTAWIATADEADTKAAVDGAKRIRAYLKAINAARDLRMAAVRLEATALRRLAQLGEIHQVKGPNRGVGERYAAMSAAEFARFLSEIEARGFDSAISYLRHLDHVTRTNGYRDEGRRAGAGEAVRPIDPATGDDVRWLAHAAAALLHDYAPEGRPFSVAEVADELARSMGEDDITGPAREGYIEAVRQAIQAAAYDDNESASALGEFGVPPWITYEEDTAGYIRVPARVASLGQLRYMAELRETQAAELAAVARRLRSAVEDFEAMGGTDAQRLLDIWARTNERMARAAS